MASLKNAEPRQRGDQRSPCFNEPVFSDRMAMYIFTSSFYENTQQKQLKHSDFKAITDLSQAKHEKHIIQTLWLHRIKHAPQLLWSTRTMLPLFSHHVPIEWTLEFNAKNNHFHTKDISYIHTCCKISTDAVCRDIKETFVTWPTEPTLSHFTSWKRVPVVTS